jgi:ParB family chromosome partitioning protein
MTVSDIDTDTAHRYAEANPSNLVVSDLNERKHDTDPSDEFIDDVRANGVEDPILVRETGDPEHEYEIVAGQRRWLAASEAERSSVPIRVERMDDSEARSRSIRENFRSTFAKDASVSDRARAIQELWQDKGNDGLPSSSFVGEQLNVSKTTAGEWIEPLRPEWRGTPVDPSSDHRTIDLDKVGTKSLSLVRRLDTSPENRVELVQRVEAGKETQRTLRDLRDRDVDAHLRGDSSDHRTIDSDDEHVVTGNNSAETDDSDYYTELIDLVERYNDEHDTGYLVTENKPQVLIDALSEIVRHET